MGFLKMLGGITSSFFGSSANGKGLVGGISDAVSDWMPSAGAKHKQNLENQKAGDESQAAAYGLVLTSHDSWFDIFVDGLNRLPRPLLTLWLIGLLYNWWPAPDLSMVHPMILNIMWTIITFWFGSRMVIKDVPAAILAFKQTKLKSAKKAKDEKEFNKIMDEVVESDDYDS